MSDDTDIQNKSGKRRKRPNPASSSECSDSGNELAHVSRPASQLASSSEDTDSDIDNEFVKKLRHKKRVQNVASDDNSSSSEEEEIIAVRPPTKRAARILSDLESGSSDNQFDNVFSTSSDSSSEDEDDKKSAKKSKQSAVSDSGAESDGQSEKCPICLVRFSSQEIGTPESCDHCFCADCIQEWAKNVNTCPVDRQPFSLILVREQLEGKVVRQIPVSAPSTGPDVVIEDPTFCEVCGQSDREDRMLLCDVCDHGYHMECLTPPLEYVPLDQWFCPECAVARQRPTRRRVRQNTERQDNSENQDDFIDVDNLFDDDWSGRPRARAAPRMVPRTRHSERVRTRLRNRQGNQPTTQRQNQQPMASSGVESMEGDTVRRRSQTSRTQRRRTKRRARTSNIRIKRIVTDDGVVEVVLKRKKKKRGRKRKTRTVRAAPRTTKGRLADKLGICKPRMPRQTIPESYNRQEVTSAPINHHRHQAGLPTLDLFGRRDQLDYFSGSDYEEDAGVEDGSGLGVISRVRVARLGDRLINRKKALSVLSTTTSRKPVKVQPITPSASGSLLDSILDSQTLWHSKKAEIKSRSDGSVQVILPSGGKDEIVKESNKIDVRKATASVVETPMFPGGKGQSSGTTRPEGDRGGSDQGVTRGGTGQSYEVGSTPSSGGGDGAPVRADIGGAPGPLRGTAPIRFRMNIPPRRPNIHSYPTDNIPPPPPLRLRLPMVEMPFPSTNSPEASPAREEDEIDIYSDIEQQNNDNEADERPFGALEPPPEPPFMMTLEPPPEPPALLMNLNDDASDDEPSGLVIDDPPMGDVYDPCASEESSQEDVDDTNLPEPPELPPALKRTGGLVSNYSSGSSPATESSSYNPELPTYSNTALVIPLPRPSSRNSSEADDNEDECPNFSMYSAESMNIAQRGLSSALTDLDIPVPPTPKKETNSLINVDIPLPDTELPKLLEDTLDIPIPEDSKKTVKEDVEDDLDIPFPEDAKSNDSGAADITRTIPKDNDDEDENSDTPISKDLIDDDDGNLEIPFPKSPNKSDKNAGLLYSNTSQLEQSQGNDDNHDNLKDKKSKNERKGSFSKGLLNIDISPNRSDDFGKKEEDESNEDDGQDGDDEGDDPDDDKEDSDSASDYGACSKLAKSKKILPKTSEEAAEDECSTQGDVLDLAIESEANLENNVPHEDDEGHREITSPKGLGEVQGVSEKDLDGGEKSDGLVDITDEEMSVYDTNEGMDDLEKLDENNTIKYSNPMKDVKSLYSDDDSLVMGDSFGTAVNSYHVPVPTLPGLEGLETETISESEDVNFDELPLESNEQNDMVLADDDHKSAKRKKKKNRKASHTDDNFSKSGNDPLEFEEGEIVDDKPKQMAKTGKKVKPKPDNVVEVNENVDSSNKQKAPTVEKEVVGEKKLKKKKDKISISKDKTERTKEPKEKTLKAGPADENISWKKISRSTKERNYRDAKEKEEKDKRRGSKEDELAKKRRKEKRKELERYDVRRLISEKPKRPKKDEFGRDISPSNSGSSLSPYRPPRYRSPLRTRNRSRTRSRSHRSRSRSKGRRRRSRSRERVKSREKQPRRSRSKERLRKRSLSRKNVPSRERRKTPEKSVKKKVTNRSPSRTKRRSRSQSIPSKRQKSISLSRSWTPSFSRSSMSQSISPPPRLRSRSFTRSRSGSWPRRGPRNKDPPENLTVIVTNKEALRKKEKKKLSKRKDVRKKKRGQSPAPSKEVFTSGDNILVSVNFKNANKTAELISAPISKEVSKRKRDDVERDSASKKKKIGSASKKSPTVKKSNRLARINEAAKNAKPVAIIDLDLSPFREQTPSPKEVIVLTDSENEGEKQPSEMDSTTDRMGNKNMNQSMMSLSSNDHGQKGSLSQPESPLSSNFMMSSSGPKTPPEPHIKFSIAPKPSQIRIMSNPLIEDAEEEMQDDEHTDNDINEILHKGPNTPPEPPPELNTPASPPTTPYDPFDPTKSRSPSPQPRESENDSQLNASREEHINMFEGSDDLPKLKNASPPSESTEIKRTPEPSGKVHSTPKSDLNNSEASPKGSPPSDPNKLSEDNLMKQKILSSASKVEVSVHKSPDKLVTVVMSQQIKSVNLTPKQPVQPLKAATPVKHQTPKTNAKVQLFSNSLLKQVPILGTLPLLSNPALYAQSLLNNSNKSSGRGQQNGDPSDDMDIDPSSPYSPGSSEGDDLFEPPMATPPRSASKSAGKTKPVNKFDALFGSSPAKARHGRHLPKSAKKTPKSKSKGLMSKKEEIKVKLDEDQLKILDDLPSSAVEMQVKDKFLKKLNRQERVVEEVKLVLKPHYVKKHVTKDEYKEILRRSVPKICHNKSGEINPIKIQSLIEAYVKKFRYAKKKATGATNNNSNSTAAQNKPKPQKTLWS